MSHLAAILHECCPLLDCWTLLEDLAVSPVVGLAVDLNGLVPRPHVVDKLLVLGLGWVELGELVALVVGSNVECRERLLASDDKGATNDRVVGLSVDRAGSEEVLAAGLKTGEETTCNLLVKTILLMYESGYAPIRLLVMNVMVSSSLYL